MTLGRYKKKSQAPDDILLTLSDRIAEARVHTTQAREQIRLISCDDGANNAPAIIDALQDLASAVELMIGQRVPTRRDPR